MIYHDAKALFDEKEMPMNRNENCLHCGSGYSDHYGWACNLKNGTQGRAEDFGSVSPHERYETQSMRNNISVQLATLAYAAANLQPIVFDEADFAGMPSLVSDKPKVELAEWRTWAHNQPGDCACGIKRVQCEFHKGT